MKTILILLLALLVTGCGTLNDGIRYAAEANDTAIKSAEFTICNAATVGSVRRAYGSPEKQVIWKQLCNAVDDFSPAEPR